MGLIAAGDRDRLRQRHIDDSLRALGCIRQQDLQVVDLGSGAGLPGIPLAIAMPDRAFILVESRRRRAAFLELVVDDLGLANVSVLAARAEEMAVRADCCMARAFAPAASAWRVADRILVPGGRLIYFAGRRWDMASAGDLRRIVAVSAEICVPKLFTWQGPLVIMTRFSPTDWSQDHEPTHV